MTPLLSTLVFLLAAGLATPALADWIVAKVSQSATYAADGSTWRTVLLGMHLPNDAWVHTGRRGRVILRQGRDTIQVKPNTVAAVSVRSRAGKEETTVIQKFGSILLDVDPSSGRASSVQSPYLAAVVKGTSFEILVDLEGSSLSVDRGLVEVTDLVRGLRVDVRPRQRVRVPSSEEAPFVFRGPGPKAPIVEIVPPPARVSSARPATSAAGAGGAAGPAPRGQRGDGDDAPPIAQRYQPTLDRTGAEESPATPEPPAEPESSPDEGDPPAAPAPAPDPQPPQVPDEGGPAGGAGNGDGGGMPDINDEDDADDGGGVPIDGN